MGIYLNPGNEAFKKALRSKIYVDKTGLIAYTNEVLGTEQQNICISRPRRFGKSMAANMLVAYYGRGCDSMSLFENLEIAKNTSFKEHLNKYDVIFLNMQTFLTCAESPEKMVDYLQESLLDELKIEYAEEILQNEKNLTIALEKIYRSTNKGFVFVIDEWDCIFREKTKNLEAQTKYLDFLRYLLKDRVYVKLAYMTGILPIKKYGTHSALNMFDEYSMTNPRGLAKYVGFTEEEVKDLCEEYDMDFEETKRWYDGYTFRRASHIYSPKSVVDAMRHGEFDNYWTQTETYEALKVYIEMNFDGLKDNVVQMLGGGRCRISPETFQNDMTTFHTKDDVLTLLVHLGYLAYDSARKEVFIPNEEVRAEFTRVVNVGNWTEVVDMLAKSEQLLSATLEEDATTVSQQLDKIHMDFTSILTYNNENSLSCVITLAYYSARNYYTLIRELPTGKGFADIVFIPHREYDDKPAMIVELKWDKSAKGAVEQIKNNQYVMALEKYKGNLLLVGINYNKEYKIHECIIEKWIL